MKSKTYSYLTENKNEDKKSRNTKRCDIKKKNFEDYKSCLEGTQLKNKINCVEWNKIDVDSWRIYKK